MKYKFMYLLLSLFMFVGQVVAMAQGQERNVKGKRLVEQRIDKQASHMANILMLDDGKTVEFSVVYKKYLLELQNCQQGVRALFADKVKVRKELLTDAEIEQIIQIRFEQCRKILDIREKYHNEFKKILTSKQIFKLYTQEKMDRRKIMKELEHRKANRNN